MKSKAAAFLFYDHVTGTPFQAYTTLFSPSVFSITSITPRVITIKRLARAAIVGSKWYST